MTAALAALIAFMLARAIARPVRRVAEATRTLASSTSTPPLVPVEGARELALLAESFNEVAVALTRAREAEQAFLLSVSHELKTPLTAIRGYAEGLGEGALPVDEAAATIVIESRRLERLVGDLLDLARMRKAEFSVRREPIDLSAIAQEALRRCHDAQARDFGVTLAADGAAAAPATGDADRTLQIISNLVENALRLTPAGGSVRIVTAPGSIQSRTPAPASSPRSWARPSSASTSTPATGASGPSARGSVSRSSRSWPRASSGTDCPSRVTRLRWLAQRVARRVPLASSLLPPVPDVVVPAGRLTEQLAAVLRAWGMSEEHVQTAVLMMLYADLAGIDSHGIGMLPTYQSWRAKGWINLQPAIRVERESPTTALLDGDGSLGHVPAHRAMQLAIDKCRKMGLGAVAVRNSTHFGAAGAYAALASEAGFLGLATTSAVSLAIVPTFGCEPMFGTNPLAFAAPAGRNPPFLIDMATSTVAIGKITLAVHRGKCLPAGWAVDEQGRPLRNACRASRLHWLTPLGGETTTGGHKGYGLAAMVEILSALLPGSTARWTQGPRAGTSQMPRVGHFLLALDPALYRAPGEFASDMDAMIDALHACKPTPAHEGVLVAGDPERRSTITRKLHGIPLSRSLVEQLRQVARAAGVPFLLDGGATS